jgi:hypothetical protein
LELLEQLARELLITAGNGEVWVSIGIGLVFSLSCTLFGIRLTRAVGLLDAGAPAGETLAVGLASGLLVFTSFWASIRSGGRSSFSPVAVGLSAAIALALIRRVRRPTTDEIGSEGTGSHRSSDRPSARRTSLIVTALGGFVFIVVVALAYGSTMAPSPRDGGQPVEFTDEAFYSVLGRDLSTTGLEVSYSPSGFANIPGLPDQTWYHWGELWLASAMITIFGVAPIAARFFIVLPVLLLAAAALSGTLVRRMTTSNSRAAYLFGFLACLFLAPIPLPGPYFGSWAVGLVFGITLYGMSAVGVLISMYCVAVLGSRRPTWELVAFVGSAIAFIVPAHLAIAVLASVGVGVVSTIRIWQSIRARRKWPTVSPVWGRATGAACLATIATVAWGVLTGHGLGAPGFPPSVPPFSNSWRDSVALTLLGFGTMLLIPAAMVVSRRVNTSQTNLCLGTGALLVLGAIAWGARFGDVTMFHVFYGGIAVFAVPAAAVAIWALLGRLLATGHRRAAAVLVVLTVTQLEVGLVAAVWRMQSFGPYQYPMISASVLSAISHLPPGARLAYVCNPLEEAGFADPSLVSIDAHTDHRVIPMCFEADLLSTFIGAPRSTEHPNSSFKWAPQRSLYPDVEAQPDPAAILAFLRDNDIGYIYVDSGHPNLLVANATAITTNGEFELLRVP